jgi:uncharacterized protein (TIGR02145 family)
MKTINTIKKASLATLLTFVLTLSSVFAQNDTMYVMKDGAVVGQYNVNTEVDSVIFYNPTVAQNDTAGTFTDSRDGNEYNWVKIGDQVWMAENLRATHYADGTPIPKVTGDTEWDNLGTSDKAYCWYNNDSASNAETYGALYTWAAAMDGAASSNSNPSGVQGICPDGWHLPSDAEWKELEMYLGMSETEANSTGWRGTNQGSKLADSANLWQDGDLENNAAFGTSGFTALPGGYRSNSGTFTNVGYNGYWWSATEHNAAGAWDRVMSYYYSNVYSYYGNSLSGFSVRCLRD